MAATADKVGLEIEGKELGMSDKVVSRLEGFEFNKALSSIDEGLKLLANELLPKEEVDFKDRWNKRFC